LIVTEEGSAYSARLNLASDKVEPLVRPDTMSSLDQSTAAGHTAVLASSDAAAPEIYALDSGKLRPLSSHNKDLQAELRLAAVQDVHSRAATAR